MGDLHVSAGGAESLPRSAPTRASRQRWPSAHARSLAYPQIVAGSLLQQDVSYLIPTFRSIPPKRPTRTIAIERPYRKQNWRRVVFRRSRHAMRSPPIGHRAFYTGVARPGLQPPEPPAERVRIALASEPQLSIRALARTAGASVAPASKWRRAVEAEPRDA